MATRRRSVASLGAACALASLTAACDPCFGTVYCHVAPNFSLTGRVIEHATGLAVPGTRVVFLWRSGVLLDADSAVSIAASDGAFELRGIPAGPADVHGRLIVTPPPPKAPYTVDDFVVVTTRARGDGVYLGNLVVDPYYLFVGEVRDRLTNALVPGAVVHFARTGGVLASPDTFAATADEFARVFVNIRMYGGGALDAIATVDAPGLRTYHIPLHLPARYVDIPALFLDPLRLGGSLPQFADVRRRGFPGFVPGVVLTFKRTGGVAITPDTMLTLAIPSTGVVALNLKPIGDGVVLGVFTVKPPAPFATEVFNVAMPVQDGDSVRRVFFGFGAQVYARAHFVYRANGDRVEQGVSSTIRRQSGLPLLADGVLVPLDSTGTLNYTSATDDVGATGVDLEVHLRAPFDHDTIRGLSLTSRMDSIATDLGVVRVGRWIPWVGTVLDATTDAPVAGAHIEFRRTAGIAIAPSPFKTTSAPDGSFVMGPVPLRGGEVIGELAVSFVDTFRDTIVAGVRLTTSKDDTVRVLPPIRVNKKIP